MRPAAAGGKWGAPRYQIVLEELVTRLVIGMPGVQGIRRRTDIIIAAGISSSEVWGVEGAHVHNDANHSSGYMLTPSYNNYPWPADARVLSGTWARMDNGRELGEVRDLLVVPPKAMLGSGDREMGISIRLHHHRTTHLYDIYSPA